MSMLVLSSQSPRRRQLLEQAGFSFLVRTASVQEIRAAGESPKDYVMRLARAKSEAVPCNPGEIILGADTTVVIDNDVVLEKPQDNSDARRMLRLLSGRSHVVLTGICLRDTDRRIVDVESTTVRFSTLTTEEIEAYIASGEPFDKAGAYAIQGLASKFVEHIDGCFFNIVGLPISLVHRRLKELY